MSGSKKSKNNNVATITPVREDRCFLGGGVEESLSVGGWIIGDVVDGAVVCVVFCPSGELASRTAFIMSSGGGGGGGRIASSLSKGESSDFWAASAISTILPL